MKLKENVKSFAMNLGVGVAVQIVRGWLNEKLKDVKPNDLYESITNNTDLWNMTPDEIKNQGLGYKKTYGNLLSKYKDMITTELLLQWISEDHPELYSTIINVMGPSGEPIGILWFDGQVNKIKNKLLE